MCNAKGVVPKVSMIWHFSSYVHKCSCRSSMLWFVRRRWSIHEIPWWPNVKEEAKIWTRPYKKANKCQKLRGSIWTADTLNSNQTSLLVISPFSARTVQGVLTPLLYFGIFLATLEWGINSFSTEHKCKTRQWVHKTNISLQKKKKSGNKHCSY